MKSAIKRILLLYLLVALGLTLFLAPALASQKVSSYGTFMLVAEDTGYGAKNPVTTIKEAKSALTEYFKDKDVKIGAIVEKELFFEAEILDRSGKLVDRVIIDKRTGRIRSIY